MALLVGDLVATMDVNDQQYHSKLDKGESRFMAVAGALGRGVLQVSKAAGVAMLAAGALGLSTASQLEQAEIGFTTMLGSAQAAQAFMSDLSAFAKSTPFEFPQLQSAASRLVSVGVNANRVIPIMRVLGDSTAAMGTGADGIDRATMALQQMQVKGKVTGEEMLQLAEAGVPAWEALAAHLGVTTAKAQDMVTKGKVKVNDLYQAIETGAGASLQRVSGMMDVQAQSMAGMWSALKDTVSVGLAQAIEPLIPLIKDGLGTATEFAAANAPRLAAGLQQVVTWVTALVTQLKSGDTESMSGPLRAVVETINQLRSGDTEGMSTSIASVKDSARELVPAIQELSQSLPSLNDVVSVSSQVFGFFAEHADLIDDVLPYVIAAVLLYKAAQTAGNLVAIASLPIQAAQVVSNFRLAAALRATAASSTSSAATQVAASGAVQASTLRTAITVVAAQFRMVGGWIATGAAAVASAAVTTGAWVATQVRTVASLAVMAAGFVAQGAVMVASAVATAAGVVAGWVLMGVQSLLQAGRMAAAWLIAMGPVGWVIAAVIGLTALIIANWDTVVSWTKQAWEWVYSKAIKPAVDTVLAYVRWWIGNVLAVVDWFRELPGRVGGYWQMMYGAVWDKIVAVVDLARGLPGRVLGALGNLGDLLLNAGGDVVRGLWRGIDGMRQWLTDRIISFVKAAIPEPVRRALGMQSPSRVMAELGRLSGVGLAQGLLGTEGLVARAAAQVGSRLADGTGLMSGPALATANGGTGGRGMYIGQVNLRAYTDRFDLGQVQDELYFRTVS